MAYGILHTDTKYDVPFMLPGKHNWEDFAISYLTSQEKQLYAMLGKSDFTSFMVELHRLLNSAEEVRDILARFKKANIVNTFGLPQNLKLANQDIQINLHGDQIQLDKIFSSLNGIPNVHVDIPSKTVAFNYNEGTIKQVMNNLDNRKFEVTGKNNLSRVTKVFKEWLSANQNNILNIQVNGKSTNTSFTTQTSSQAKDLFGLTKDQIEKAVYEDPVLKQQLIDIRRRVYMGLYVLCSGSKDLQDIFDNVWTQKMGKIESTDISTLLKFSFLSKGGNLNAGVSGAIQEMYGAMLIEYIHFLAKKNLPSGLVKIMGNIAEGGEQPKADLVILNDIGIQVKAYGMGNKIKHIESNLHPNALDAQLRPYGAVNVGDAIVQSVFNTDRESPDSISERLRDYVAALLNLKTSAGLSYSSTVCFYLIDAQYLVPGSEILRAFNTQVNGKSLSTYSVKITSSFEGKSTDQYKETIYKTHNAYKYKTMLGTRVSPDYLRFFDKAGTEEIHPDENNEKWYNNLYTKYISIRTVFDYGFAEANIYRIF